MSSRPRPYFKPERKKEGDLRNLAWAALSTQEKILSLGCRPGDSKRQLKKLGARYPKMEQT